MSSPISPETTRKLARLADAGIQILPLPGIHSHFVLEREGYAVLVERTTDGFGQIGSAGKVTEEGLALLVWSGERASFVAKGKRHPAGPEDVTALRAFHAAVRLALEDAGPK